MNSIKVDIDQNKNRITVYNNGKGIPVTIHKEHNVYVPELIFGHLLTSSNYDDTAKKVTGGRNGYGAKLTNIFSKKFIVETADSKSKKKYVQEYAKNMSDRKEPEISSFSEKDYTKITFEPDLSKFKMKELDDDIISLLYKRVYDVAGTTPAHINVFLNGKKIQIKNFKEYADFYFKDNLFDDKIEYPKIYDSPHERWEVIVSMADAQFQQVSFVNGICTIKGGTHVNYVTDQIVERISEHVKKKHKDLKLKAPQIKQNLWIFVNSLIENPTFDSQTKETLTLQSQSFGSKCELSEKLFKEVLKSPIVSNIVDFFKAKEKVKLHKALSSNIKKSSRLLGIEKLEDANEAGTKNFEKCTLILTEGDSAKALAMSGIEVVGRDYYGVFPLKGKFLNVRDAKDNQIIDNEEIQNLIKILGLQMGKNYENELKGLRYGHLMIMADQDYDGSHIKGLILNFIHHFWPSLIKRNGFIKEFVTPIVKVSKGDQVKCFYTLKEYKEWYEINKNLGWKIKYYKGLGTSTTTEAKEYFSSINKNRINFKYLNNEDDHAIELGFSKANANMRKEWLSNFDPLSTFIDHSKSELRIKDFINKELIFFSNADNIRSIPNILDGLKPSERKIIYACFKRNLKSELKVAQLAGYVAEHSAYHHGEMSLCSTIIALAQDFVGTNNINLLQPIGQFGNRYTGPKSAASARYIYTCLSKLTRKIFREEDDYLLTYQVDEGMKIEPVYYVPILPLVLVNGAEGIGTGWATSIPQYDPIEIVQNLICKLEGQEYKEMKPWFRGFTGDVSDATFKNNLTSYSVIGKISIIEDDDNTVEISELPIRNWTRDYKTFLEKNHVDNKDANPNSELAIEDIKEYHTENYIQFRIRLTEDCFKKVSNMNNEEKVKLFKLSTSISISNMVLFDSSNKIRKYQNVNEILDEFYNVRLEHYTKRKDHLLAKLKYHLELSSNKINFIRMVLNGTLPLKNLKKSEIFSLLKSNGFLSNSELKKKYKNAFKLNTTDLVIEENEEGGEKATSSDSSDYDYLMNMNIWSLTHERMEELDNNIKNYKYEIEILEKSTEQDLWKKDLEDFLFDFNDFLNNTVTKKSRSNISVNGQSKLNFNKQSSKGKKTSSNGVTKSTKLKGKKKEEDDFINDDNEESFSEYSDDSGSQSQDIESEYSDAKKKKAREIVSLSKKKPSSTDKVTNGTVKKSK
jgi:DNA topoisomerase II